VRGEGLWNRPHYLAVSIEQPSEFPNPALILLWLGRPVYQAVGIQNHVYGIESQAVKIAGPAATAIDYMRNDAMSLVAVIAFDELVAKRFCQFACRVRGLGWRRRHEGPVHRIEVVVLAVRFQNVRRVRFWVCGDRYELHDLLHG